MPPSARVTARCTPREGRLSPLLRSYAPRPCLPVQLGGVYDGSITFMAPCGQYLWYTVEMDVGSPVAENTIEARARVRQALAIELVIDNPFPER